MKSENYQSEITLAIETLPFHTKEEYFTWRKEWRKKYRQVSQLIRKAKNERKTVYGNPDLSWNEEDEVSYTLFTEKNFNHRSPEHLWVNENKICRLFYLKNVATDMLIERAASKILANIQYNASLALVRK